MVRYASAAVMLQGLLLGLCIPYHACVSSDGDAEYLLMLS